MTIFLRTVIHGDAASVTSTRGDVDHDDASTRLMKTSPFNLNQQVVDGIGTGNYPYPATAPIRRKSPTKTSIVTLRDTTDKPKPTGTALLVVVDDKPPLTPVVVKPRRAPAAKPQRPRPPDSDVRGRLSLPSPRCLVPSEFLSCVNN